MKFTTILKAGGILTLWVVSLWNVVECVIAVVLFRRDTRNYVFTTMTLIVSSLSYAFTMAGYLLIFNIKNPLPTRSRSVLHTIPEHVCLFVCLVVCSVLLTNNVCTLCQTRQAGKSYNYELWLILHTTLYSLYFGFIFDATFSNVGIELPNPIIILALFTGSLSFFGYLLLHTNRVCGYKSALVFGSLFFLFVGTFSIKFIEKRIRHH